MLSPSVIPPAFDAGSVRLVSAGPGGQKLLALRAVQKAAIILDATRVSGEIFSVPSPGAPDGPRRCGSITGEATRSEQTARITNPREAVDQPALLVPAPVEMLRQRLAAWQLTVVANQQQTRIAG